MAILVLGTSATATRAQTAEEATPSASEAGQPSTPFRPQAFELEGPATTPTAEAEKAGKAAETAGVQAAKKDCTEALERFQEAYRLAGRAETLTAAAKCHDSLGHFVEAHGLVSQLLRDHTPPESKEREAREEWLAELEGKTAELKIELPVSGARVEVDGVVWLTGDEESIESVAARVAPGEHSLSIAKADYEDLETAVTLEAGSSQTLEADLVRIPEPKPLPPAVPLPPGGLTQADVKDFCRITVGNSERKYQRQKLVLFDLAGEAVTAEPEQEVDQKGKPTGGRHSIFGRANIHGHLRTVFFATFPSSRFYTVKARTQSPAALRKRPSIAAADMVRAAEGDAFAAYSIACADWVGMPRVVGKKAKWQRVERMSPKGKYTAWDVDTVWHLEMDVYRLEGDTWRLLETIDASNGGLLKIPGELGEITESWEEMKQAGDKPLPLVSDRPNEDCEFEGAISSVVKGLNACSAVVEVPAQAEGGGGSAVVEAGKMALEGAATASACVDSVEAIADSIQELRNLASSPTAALRGLATCAGAGVSFELPAKALAPGSGQLRTGFCKDVADGQLDDVARGDDAMYEVATCRARVAVDLATLALQKQAHRLPGWRLYAPLVLRGPGFGLALGTHEGAKRGDAYRAVEVREDGQTHPLGPFGRLATTGPGGTRGEQDPSEFRFRRGEAEPDTRMEEFAQIGLVLGLRPEVSYYLLTGDIEPGIGVGGVLEGGYNASQYVPAADEIWARVYLGAALAEQDIHVYSLEVVPEGTFYLSGGLAAFAGVGFSFAIIDAPAPAPAAPAAGPDTADATRLTGMNYGGVLAVGLDYALSPAWNVRLQANYRQAGSKAKLEDKDHTTEVDAGLLSAARGGLGLSYTF